MENEKRWMKKWIEWLLIASIYFTAFAFFKLLMVIQYLNFVEIVCSALAGAMCIAGCIMILYTQKKRYGIVLFFASILLPLVVDYNEWYLIVGKLILWGILLGVVKHEGKSVIEVCFSKEKCI